MNLYLHAKVTLTKTISTYYKDSSYGICLEDQSFMPLPCIKSKMREQYLHDMFHKFCGTIRLFPCDSK